MSQSSKLSPADHNESPKPLIVPGSLKDGSLKKKSFSSPTSTHDSPLARTQTDEVSPRRIRFDQQVTDDSSSEEEDWDFYNDNKFDDSASRYAIQKMENELAALKKKLNSKVPLSALKQRSMSFNIRSVVEKLNAANKAEAAAIEQEKINRKKRLKKVFNFVVGTGAQTKLFRFENISLGIFTKQNRFRQFCVKILASDKFQSCILAIICLNALIIASCDYAHVDSSGELIENGSWINTLNANTNLIFIGVFTLEMLIKFVAQGVYGNHGSYLSSSWNILDFIVVVTGILTYIDSSLENVSSLRIVRVLRPLRTLKMIPAMRSIISSIFVSIPQLGGVFSLMGFIIFLFAIVGMELFGDASLHARCRSTPYPVLNTYVSPHADPTSLHNYVDFRCIPGSTFSTAQDGLNQENSPWRVAKDCYWPIAPSSTEPATRECSLSGTGINTCIHDTKYIPEKDWSWCGSNYDARGNQRFLAHGVQIYGNGFYPMNDIDMYDPELNFGYSNFDNLGVSVLTIFQIITQEGWTKILYLCMDSHGYLKTIPFFVLLILFGVYFVLQLLLAVLEDNFSTASHKFAESVKAEKLEMEYKLLQMQGDYSEKNIAIAVVHSSYVQRKLIRYHLEILGDYTEKNVDITIFQSPEEFIHQVGNKQQNRLVNEFHMLITGDSFPASGQHSKPGLQGHQFVKYLRTLPVGPLFRLKHIIGISAAPETYRALFKKAGAKVTIANKPVDFDKSVGGKVNEDDDIIHVALNCLKLGSDVYSTTPSRASSPDGISRQESSESLSQHVPLEDSEDDEQEMKGDESMFRDSHSVYVSDAGTSEDQYYPINASTAILQSNHESDDESSNFTGSEENGIFVVKHAKHEYEDNFRAVMRCGDSLMCCNNAGHKRFDRKAVMQVIGKPLTGLIKKKCRICENLINYHYMKCNVCTWQVCMECAATEWDSQTVYPGEKIDTPYGKCIVDEYRDANAIGSNLHNDWLMDVPSIVCTPINWQLANRCEPKFHLNLHELKPIEYGVGDEIICAYGGAGVIVGMRKSLHEFGGIVYIVELAKWKLATGKSPVLFLTKPSILRKTKDNVHKRISNMDTLLRLLDHAAADINPDHDYDTLSPSKALQLKLSECPENVVHSVPQNVRKLCTVRKSISNVTMESNLTDASRASGSSNDFYANNPTAKISAVKVARAPNRGIAGFLGNRLIGFKNSLRMHSRNTPSQSSDGTNELPDVSADELVKRRDPDSFAHMNVLLLEDLVGESVAKCISAVRKTFSRYKLLWKETFMKYKFKVFPKKKKIVGLKQYKSAVELKGWAKYRHTIKSNCVRLADWDKFDLLSGGFIALNSIVLMCDHYPMNEDTGNTLDLLNAILTIIFTGEMAVNIIARGFSFYIKDFMSGFDGFVVIASLFDLGLAPPSYFGSTGLDVSGFAALSSTISLLRCFRLFRMIKLGLKIKSLKILLFRIVKTFYHLGAFVILLCVLLFCFTVAGLQFFSNRFHFDEAGDVITDIGSPEWVNAAEISRYNFDDFSLSFASVFQLLTTENWNDIMFDCWRVYGPFGTLFPVVWLLIGTFVLMNLFLGILLGNFTGDDENEADAAIAEIQKIENPNSVGIKSDIGAIWGTATMGNGMAVKLGKEKDTKKDAVDVGDIELAPMGVTFADGGYENINEKTDLEKAQFEAENCLENEEKNEGSVGYCCGFIPRSVLKSPEIKVVKVKRGSLIAALGNDQENENDVFPLPPINSCGIFSPQNPLRNACGHIADSFYFEACIQLVIFLSSSALILDNPLVDPNTAAAKAFATFELVTTVIFTMEMVVKIITFGFAFNQRAYLRNYWNVLDFVIIISSLLSTALSGTTFNGIKAIRSFRALRPLRVISRAPGLRIIVTALFESVPDVLNVVGVIVVLFTIFAVLAVNFLKGAMGNCAGEHWPIISSNDAAVNLLTYPVPYTQMTPVQQGWFNSTSTLQANNAFATCTTPPCCNLDKPHAGYNGALPSSRMICECWGGEWLPAAYQTFDNYPEALVAFIVISTTEGWIELMYAAVDSRGIDMQPVRNQHYAYIYFFILFIVIGSFFALNLFVGVMIDNFGRVKDNQRTGKNKKGSMFMTPEQQEWIRTYQLVKLIKPHATKVAPSDWIGMKMFEVQNHKYFEGTVLACIALNSIVLSISNFGMSDKLMEAIDVVNMIFAFIFTLEMAIKVLALRWTYLRSKWNWFDGIVTLGTDMGVVLFMATGAADGLGIMVVRIFRVLRVIRLIEGLENAKRLVDTLMYTLPGIINITILLVLLLFIYAALGMQLFATVGYFQTYDRYANFRSFGGSLLTLFRFTTGEGWGNYMFDVANVRPGCNSNLKYNNTMCGFDDHPGCTPLNGCGSDAIHPYLISFTIIVSMVIFNLFVGVILEGFGAANETSSCLSGNDFKIFAKRWAKYDPNGGLFITIDKFEEFVATLPSPMGLADIHPSHAATVSFLSALDIRVYSRDGDTNFVHFKDALTTLSTKAIESNKGGNLEELQAQIDFSEDVTYKETLRSGSEVVKVFSESENSYFLRDHYAALLVQHALRRNRTFKLVEKQMISAGMNHGRYVVQSIAAFMDGSEDLKRRHMRGNIETGSIPIHAKPQIGKRKTLLGNFWHDASSVMSNLVSPSAAGRKSDSPADDKYSSVEMTDVDDGPIRDISAQVANEIVQELQEEFETTTPCDDEAYNMENIYDEATPHYAKLPKRQVRMNPDDDQIDIPSSALETVEASKTSKTSKSRKVKSSVKKGRKQVREEEKLRVMQLMEENKKNIAEIEEFSQMWRNVKGATVEEDDDYDHDDAETVAKAPMPLPIFHHSSISRSENKTADMTVPEMLAKLKSKREESAKAQTEQGVKVPPPVETSPFRGFLSLFSTSDEEEVMEVYSYGEKMFSNGDLYTGSMLNGVMHGYGFYQYVDGAVYEGEMHRGQRHGLGTYQSSYGERYIGEFKHNQRDGRGVKYCADGQILDGYWYEGMFEEENPFSSRNYKM